jgi:hypothetical protein
MGRSLIRCAGFALLFATGVLIGNKAIMGGTKQISGQCGNNNCNQLGVIGGGNMFPQCPTGQCDFTIAGGTYRTCDNTNNKCNLIVPPQPQICTGGCQGQLGTTCQTSYNQCQ